MYTLERTKKMKTIWGCMAAGFFGLSVWNFMKGGGEPIFYGYMNRPLPTIVMVAAFFAALLCVGVCFTLHAIEKDAADHLSYLKHPE